jgi:hypothetical protein
VTLLAWAVTVGCCLGMAYWLFSAVVAIATVRGVPVLETLPPDPTPEGWPSLSIVVAARDEIGTLEAAVRSHLATDYPDLELVLVDDRSTDGTGALIDRLAAEDPRVTALHVAELPDGWLGKVHALDVATAQARGDWLLFCDADVHLAGAALRRIVAHVEHQQLDHVAALPTLLPVDGLTDACTSMFVRLLLGGSRPWEVRDPDKARSVGFGAFNLSRKAVLERSEGFPWLKLEIADDMALGAVMKRAGGRIGLLNARGLVRLTYYPSLGAMVRGQEKAGYSILGGFSLLRTLAVCAALPGAELLVLVGLLPVAGTPAWLPALALGGYGFGLLQCALLNRWAGLRVLPALLHPVAVFLMAWMYARGGWIGWREGGIRWRDTFYPVEQLRAGRRIQFL